MTDTPDYPDETATEFIEINGVRPGIFAYRERAPCYLCALAHPQPDE